MAVETVIRLSKDLISENTGRRILHFRSGSRRELHELVPLLKETYGQGWLGKEERSTGTHRTSPAIHYLVKGQCIWYTSRHAAGVARLE